MVRITQSKRILFEFVDVNQGDGVHIGVDKTDTGTILTCSWPGQRTQQTFVKF